MPSTTTPTQSQTITRLASQADALGALLAVIGILPAIHHERTLATCSRLANAIADELDALVGGAA